MKTTTCVRIVLPTDELVRIKCLATMTVRDLVSSLVKRHSRLRKKSVFKGSKEDCLLNGENNCDTFLASCGWHSIGSGSAPNFLQAKLTLVRTGAELQAEALVSDEVNNYDILEFRIGNMKVIAETKDQRSRNRVSPLMNPLVHEIAEAIRTVSSSSSLRQMGEQTETDGENPATRRECTSEAQLLLSPSVSRHSKMKLKELIEPSSVRKLILRKRGRWNMRNKPRILPFSCFQTHRQNKARLRKSAEHALFQAGMQLIECIRAVQMDVRRLVFLLRDAVLGGGNLNIDEMLSLTRNMVNALTQTSVDSSGSSSSAVGDTREGLVRSLCWDIAGKDGGVRILLEGWVVTAEWGTFWRSQRKEYACLCDNHVLYFFSSQTHCADFVFELSRERDGSVSETSKRLLKEYGPLSQIDLSETDWVVRISNPKEDFEKQHRHAFAFFDPHGRMRRVLDVSTATEAIEWTRVISAEMSQTKLFAQVCAPTNDENQGSIQDLNPFTSYLEKRSNSAGGQESFHILLHSLYSQVDRRNGTARAERFKSWTLNQAVKDFQRDRVQVNGRLLAGASVEANIIALTREVLKCLETVQEDNTVKHSTEGMATKEMTALRFAHQVIICSSRTQGGGAILDTLHLVFGIDRYCICPDTPSMDPIEICISKSGSPDELLSAQITMKMTYRVIPNCSIRVRESQISSLKDEDMSNAFMLNTVAGVSPQVTEAEHEHASFKIVGIFTQPLNCHFIEDKNVQGSVELQLLS